jgi:type IV pilus assembly protein PilF
MMARSTGATLAACIAAALLLASCATSSSNGRAVDNKEAARANTQLGVAYLRQGNMNQAKEKLEKAEKQDPRSHEVQYALALFSERMNQPADADHYRAALKLAPNNGEIRAEFAQQDRRCPAPVR